MAQFSEQELQMVFDQLKNYSKAQKESDEISLCDFKAIIRDSKIEICRGMKLTGSDFDDYCWELFLQIIQEERPNLTAQPKA